MTNLNHQALVADLARKTLEDLKPESKDLQYFDIYSEEYFKSPQDALAGMQVKDKPVGSGLGVGEIILIPILLWLGGKIADKVTDKLLERGLSLISEDFSKHEPTNPLLRFFKQFLRRVGLVDTAPPKSLALSMVPPLSTVEKQVLRQETLLDPEVKTLARKYQLSEELIVSLVDALVANLPAEPPGSS